MALSSSVKQALNRLLAPLNIRLESLTADRHEARRLAILSAQGQFERAVYPISPAMEAFDPAFLADAYREYAASIERLKQPHTNDVGYVYAGNGFFRSPDMEVLYCLVRRLAPGRIIEVGSG